MTYVPKERNDDDLFEEHIPAGEHFMNWQDAKVDRQIGNCENTPIIQCVNLARTRCVRTCM